MAITIIRLQFHLFIQFTIITHRILRYPFPQLIPFRYTLLPAFIKWAHYYFYLQLLIVHITWNQSFTSFDKAIIINPVLLTYGNSSN